MARCLFVVDNSISKAVAYDVSKIPTGTPGTSDFFTTKANKPFKVDFILLDKAQSKYRLVFTNAQNQRWYYDLYNDNTGVTNITIDNGLSLTVGCGDFFPELDDPKYEEKAVSRIVHLRSLKNEVDNKETTEEDDEDDSDNEPEKNN